MLDINTGRVLLYKFFNEFKLINDNYQTRCFQGKAYCSTQQQQKYQSVVFELYT